MNQDELEKKWKEEFRKMWFDGSEFHYNSTTAQSIEHLSETYKIELRGYIQACKARQKELDEALSRKILIQIGYELAKKELDEALEVVRYYAHDGGRDLEDVELLVKQFSGHLIDVMTGGKKAREFLAKIKRG